MREWQSAVTVTPSDSTNLTIPSLALLAGTDGNIKVDMARSGTVVLPVKAGIPLKVRVKKVYSTGTTATGIVALY